MDSREVSCLDAEPAEVRPESALIWEARSLSEKTW